MKTMNTLIAVIVLSYSLITNANPTGPVIAGGPIAAPRALIIYTQPVMGRYDVAGWNLAVKQAGEEKRAGVVEVIVPRNDDDGRVALCLQYRSFNDYVVGMRKFEGLLANHTTIAMTNNGLCGRPK
jgi:hypothetical protein